MNAPTREQRLDYLGVTPSETWSKGYETGYQAGRASNDQWRIAVDEALMASALDCTTPDSDPKDCINKLLAWNQEVALDPQVSSEAQTLIDRGRASLLEELRAGGVELPDALQIEQGIGYRLPQSALGLLIAMIQDYGDRRAAAIVPEGYVVVPVEPTEDMWMHLARDIVFWLYTCPAPHNGSKMHEFLLNLGTTIPEWLSKEIPDSDSTPPKGTVAVCIYRAMLEAAPKEQP